MLFFYHILYTIFALVLCFRTSLTEVVFVFFFSSNKFVFLLFDPIKSINRYFALIPFDFYWKQKCIPFSFFSTRSFAIVLSIDGNTKWHREAKTMQNEERERKNVFVIRIQMAILNTYKLCNNYSKNETCAGWLIRLPPDTRLFCLIEHRDFTYMYFTRLCASEWVFTPVQHWQ